MTIQEFNKINDTVKLLICLKDKAQAQAQAPASAQEVTEEGEPCPNIPGVIDERKITEIKNAIKDLFLKLLDKAECLNKKVFTFLGKGEDGKRSITKDEEFTGIDHNMKTKLRKNLWTLYNYIDKTQEDAIKGKEFMYLDKKNKNKIITEIIGTWTLSGNEHTNELIMIWKKITT